jgi:vacuolar-type H+-ATPase subunit I/STV1
VVWINKSLKLFGNVLFISGILLFGLMHLAIALFIPNLSGWSDLPGKLVTVLNEIIGWVPYTLSIILFIIGASIIIYDLSQIRQKSS